MRWDRQIEITSTCSGSFGFSGLALIVKVHKGKRNSVELYMQLKQLEKL